MELYANCVYKVTKYYPDHPAFGRIEEGDCFLVLEDYADGETADPNDRVKVMRAKVGWLNPAHLARIYPGEEVGWH